MSKQKQFDKIAEILNLRAVAEKTGISYNTLKNYSIGRTSIKESDLYKILELLKEYGGR